MHNGQIAQAMLRSEGEAFKPRMEVVNRGRLVVLPDLMSENRSNGLSMFGDWRGFTVLCTCGSLVRLDQSMVMRKRYMGKPVECHQCRNRRIAAEREDLDNEFYDREGE